MKMKKSKMGYAMKAKKAMAKMKKPKMGASGRSKKGGMLAALRKMKRK